MIFSIWKGVRISEEEKEEIDLTFCSPPDISTFFIFFVLTDVEILKTCQERTCEVNSDCKTSEGIDLGSASKGRLGFELKWIGLDLQTLYQDIEACPSFQTETMGSLFLPEGRLSLQIDPFYSELADFYKQLPPRY